MFYNSLGSENRDRGGIQWYSEPTSAPGPLLKININYEGCSGLSNALKTASGPGAEHRKNRNASTRNEHELKINRIPDFIVFSETEYKGLSRHIWVAILILGPVKGVRTSPSK